MAGWISSKLKVAENLLQQIDHQAAESLRKGERPRSDELNVDSLSKIGIGGGVVPPLKDQLSKKKKTLETTNDFRGKVASNPTQSLQNNNHGNKEIPKSINIENSLNTKSSLTDSDWTQLLGTPNQTRTTANRAHGGGISGLRKDGRKPGSVGMNLLEGRRNQKGNNAGSNNSLRLPDFVAQNKLHEGVVDKRPSDGEESSISNSGHKTSNSDSRSDENYAEERETHGKYNAEVVDKRNWDVNGSRGILADGGESECKDVADIDASSSAHKIGAREKASVADDGVSDMKIGPVDDHTKSGSLRTRLDSSNASSTSLISDDLMRGSTSQTGNLVDDESDSDTGSSSSSDSEIEREREERKRRRQQILAEKAAAKAAQAIKEHEDMVARLEGEKQSLEKILEDRAKQQAQEASELQTTMMETMEAADIEKQKHNNTRMEALARLGKLEMENADLARSLATAQWNLEVEVNRVSEIRQQIELKEGTHEELRRRISNANKSGTSLNNIIASKGVELEREILEAEYSLLTDKIGSLRDKGKMLETNIELTKKEMENPTEVEVQLKRRLSQLTDHLIQKQVQVEALSSEKATLQFRIEAVSRSLEENKSLLNMADGRIDLESGTWDSSKSKLRPSFEDQIRSGQQQLGSLLKQLDGLFSAGAAFLKRNPIARWWALVYLVCLHLWVVYILMSHSEASEDVRSGAVISLENINNTTGI